MDSINNMNNTSIEQAVFGGGCFWCTEAVFQMIRGVSKVYPGYAGGSVKNPTYEQICTGDTGHAEVVVVEYDPTLVSYDDLLTVFFGSHDPTTKNKQGNDVGTQYRSVIFYTTPEQKEKIEKFIASINSTEGGTPVVTEIEPLDVVYPAEDYHINYFNDHGSAGYCQIVINPKLEKVKEKFAHLLRDLPLTLNT